MNFYLRVTPHFGVKVRLCRSPNKSRERKYFSFYLKQKHIAYVFAFPLSTQTYSQIMPHGSSGTVRDYNVKTKKKKCKIRRFSLSVIKSSTQHENYVRLVWGPANRHNVQLSLIRKSGKCLIDEWCLR